MLERATMYTVQYGRGWKRGEMRPVSNFDDEGRPEASPHFELVGEEDAAKASPRDIHNPEEQKQVEHDRAQVDRLGAIQGALAKLDPESDDDWTRSGAPSVARVAEISGVETSRGEITEANPGFDREQALMESS